jgi:hypothetical protein
MERDAPVGPDTIFPQPPTGGSIQDDKHLAAFRRDFHAEAGKSNIPVDKVRLGIGRASMALLVSLMRGIQWSPELLPRPRIGSGAEETTGASVTLRPP